MKYLDQSTLKLFTYLLFGNKKFPLVFFDNEGRKNILSDISNLELEKLFLFKVNFFYCLDNFKKFSKKYGSIKYMNKKKAVRNLDKIIRSLLSSKQKIDLWELLKIKNIYAEFYLITKALDIHINNSNREKLKKFTHAYLEEYKRDRLKNGGFYPFKKNLLENADLLKEYFIYQGKDFVLDLSMKRNMIGNKKYNKKLRLIETLLCLMDSKYININGCRLNGIQIPTEDRRSISLDVTMYENICSINS